LVRGSNTAPIGIVGDGRVARHFVHYLTLLGVPVRTWARRNPGAGPVEALAECARVLILIRDAATVPFLDEWPALKDKRPVHFSGNLTTTVAHAAHPLMTFADRLYDLETYRAIPFIIDTGGPPFEQLLPGLPNPSFQIAPADRSYYHAMCVLAGNGSTLLWAKLFDAFHNRLGIPPSAAHPFLKQVAANLIADPTHALTGPLSRGDAGTIEANLAALDGDPFRDVYAALVKAHAGR
jgi:hypothetical protein